MTDPHSIETAEELRDALLYHLRDYVERWQRKHGTRPTSVTIGRSEWMALGCPEVAGGVRIMPRQLDSNPVPQPSAC